MRTSPNYRVWSFNDESGTVYRVMPWSDSIASQNIYPVADLSTTKLREAVRRAKELGYVLSR